MSTTTQSFSNMSSMDKGSNSPKPQDIKGLDGKLGNDYKSMDDVNKDANLKNIKSMDSPNNSPKLQHIKSMDSPNNSPKSSKLWESNKDDNLKNFKLKNEAPKLEKFEEKTEFDKLKESPMKGGMMSEDQRRGCKPLSPERREWKGDKKSQKQQQQKKISEDSQDQTFECNGRWYRKVNHQDPPQDMPMKSEMKSSNLSQEPQRTNWNEGQQWNMGNTPQQNWSKSEETRNGPSLIPPQEEMSEVPKDRRMYSDPAEFKRVAPTPIDRSEDFSSEQIDTMNEGWQGQKPEDISNGLKGTGVNRQTPDRDIQRESDFPEDKRDHCHEGFKDLQEQKGGLDETRDLHSSEPFHVEAPRHRAINEEIPSRSTDLLI